MIALSAAEIARAVNGELRGVAEPDRTVVTHADTDSRTMGPGSLFIAKPGETTDGHLFIDQALAAGAVVVLAQRETNDAAGQPHPAVIVDDVVAAMGALAAEIITRIRAHSETTVIGITGSAGKTTTKDLVARLLSTQGPTVAPQGSYNGEVGVPLTVFTADLETRFLVVEMGADAPGNIRELCEMTRPDIGAVLMVGSAHAGKFGGRDKIAAVKGELAEGVSRRIILNRDDAEVSAMQTRAATAITWFGHYDAIASSQHPQGVWAEQLSLDEHGHPQFTLHCGGESHPVTSGLTGAHHITNLLAAAAIAAEVGLSPADIAAGLNGQGPVSRWRMERTERPDGVTVINDAYNANPESMREALRTLAQISRGSGRRSVAVLGAMLELGDGAAMAHHQLGETVVRLNISQTLVVGQEAYALYRGAIAEGSWGSEVAWVEDLNQAHAWLQDALMPGDVVLLKSSNSCGLRLLGDTIAAEGGTE